MQTHRAVWQTWALCKPSAQKVACMEDSEQVELRMRVQKARVGRHLSVVALSEALHCDHALLAAFERGEEVLDHALQMKVCKFFQL